MLDKYRFVHIQFHERGSTCERMRVNTCFLELIKARVLAAQRRAAVYGKSEKFLGNGTPEISVHIHGQFQEKSETQ